MDATSRTQAIYKILTKAAKRVSKGEMTAEDLDPRIIQAMRKLRQGKYNYGRVTDNPDDDILSNTYSSSDGNQIGESTETNEGKMSLSPEEAERDFNSGKKVNIHGKEQHAAISKSQVAKMFNIPESEVKWEDVVEFGFGDRKPLTFTPFGGQQTNEDDHVEDERHYANFDKNKLKEASSEGFEIDAEATSIIGHLNKFKQQVNDEIEDQELKATAINRVNQAVSSMTALQKKLGVAFKKGTADGKDPDKGEETNVPEDLPKKEPTKESKYPKTNKLIDYVTEQVIKKQIHVKKEKVNGKSSYKSKR